MELLLPLIGISLLTLIASTVGMVSGFGTSTIMIPVLAMFLPPLETIMLVSIIHWFGDLWKITLFRKGFNLKLVLLFGITGFITSFFGATLSIDINKIVLLRTLGVFLIAYSIFLTYQSTFKVPAKNSLAILGGGLSGFFAGMFGIGGAIRAMFLTAFDLPKAVFLATTGTIGLMIDTIRIITYSIGPSNAPTYLWWSLCFAIPVSFVGARIGQHIVNKIPQESFRLTVTLFLCAVGIKLIIWP